MKKYLLNCIFLCLPMGVLAHLGGIRGKVSDAKTAVPLSGAVIEIKSLGKGQISDEFGRFIWENIAEGTYSLEISVLGYQKFNQTIIIKNDEITELNCLLSTSTVSLEEVRITTSNKQNQSLISALDISLRPINNSQEILRIIPGLIIGQHAGGGKAEQIFLRGFDIDHGTDIQLTADGIPINMVSHAHGQGYADAHFIIPELIEKVSFQKGLYEASKGNFSTAGWADFKTIKVLDDNLFKTEIGQFNSYRLFSALNLLDEKFKQKNQNVYIAGEANYSDAFFDAPQKFQRYNLLAKYHGHLNAQNHLTFSLSNFWSRWDASGQIPDRAVESGLIGFFGAIDPNEGGQTARSNINAELVSNLGKGILKNQVYFSNYQFTLFSNFTFFLNDSLNGDQIKQKESRNLWGINTNYSVKTNFMHPYSELTIGISSRSDLVRNSELSHTRLRNEILKYVSLGDIAETNLGLFAEENMKLSTNIEMTLGIRIDNFMNRYKNKLENNVIGRVSSSIVSPKFNLNYLLNEHLKFYFNSGKGFHSNDTRAVVGQNGLSTLPPAYGFDAGMMLKPNKKIYLNLAYWYLWLKQEFVYVGDEGIIEPSGKSLRKGFDVSFRYQITDKLFFDTDANWAIPRALEEPKGKDFLPLSVKFSSVGGITLKNEHGISGSIRYRYLADRPANEDNSIVAKGYFINDAFLSFSHKRYLISLSIQNIFDVRWKETQFATLSRLKTESQPVEEIHFTPGTPRNAKLSFLLKF